MLRTLIFYPQFLYWICSTALLSLPVTHSSVNSSPTKNLVRTLLPFEFELSTKLTLIGDGPDALHVHRPVAFRAHVVQPAHIFWPTSLRPTLPVHNGYHSERIFPAERAIEPRDMHLLLVREKMPKVMGAIDSDEWENLTFPSSISYVPV